MITKRINLLIIAPLVAVWAVILATPASADGRYKPKPKPKYETPGTQEQGQHQNIENTNDLSNRNKNQNINLQGQSLDNYVTSDSASRSDAVSESDSYSNSRSSAHGGSSHATGGESDASASAVAGDSSAITGDSTSSASSGDNNTNVVISGKVEAKNPTSPAPAVYAAYCTQSASGQGFDGGSAVSMQDPLCQHLEMSNRYLIAYRQMYTWCSSKGRKEGTTHPACDYEMEARFLELHLDHLAQANRIMQQTSITGQVAKTSIQLAFPAALIYVLVLLL